MQYSGADFLYESEQSLRSFYALISHFSNGNKSFFLLKEGVLGIRKLKQEM